MKKINLIYLALIPVFVGILYINWNYARHTAMFYGFAENKDTEINHDHPVQVTKLHVTPGQYVNEGDLLVEVTHTKFNLKMNDLTHDIEAMKLRAQERKAEIQRAIRQLETERLTKVNDIEIRMGRLQSEIDLNQSLLKNLKSIKTQEGTSINSPNKVKMAALQKELEIVVKPYDLEIKQLQDELATVNAPHDVQVSKLENEKNFYASEQEKLAIRAPKDGLIGNVHCKEGENISSFNTLITLYGRNPTLVKGYVHENLIVHVKEGDTLAVSSSLHPDQKGLGTVVGLGSRIVEIPERLRKMPEIKTYGREVLIQIPPDNPFLQKEKVVLNFLNPEEVAPTKLVPILDRSNQVNQKNQEAAFRK